MTDFMQWLYAHYIWPYLAEQPVCGPFEVDLSLIDTDLNGAQKENVRRSIEYYAIHAFLLGLKTGEGLAASVPSICGNKR